MYSEQYVRVYNAKDMVAMVANAENPRYWLDPSTKRKKGKTTQKDVLKPTRVDESRQRNVACAPRIGEREREREIMN